MAHERIDEPLSDEVAELLEDYGQGEAPSERMRRRMWRELGHSIDEGAEPLFPVDDVDPPRAASSKGRRLGVVVGALAVAAGLAALVWTKQDALGIARDDDTPTAAQNVSEQERATQEAAKKERRRAGTSSAQHSPQPEPQPEILPEPVPEPEPATEPTPEPDTTEANQPAPAIDRGARPTKTKSKAPTRPSSNLDEEAASLAVARRALTSGDAKTALRKLKSHEKRFSGGLLEQEREVLYVQALCAAGQTQKAQRRAARFTKRYPGSPHTSMVRGACTAD